MFICPICKGNLSKLNSIMECQNGHSFDISRQGYVHLLPPNKMHSKVPGDTKEMVDARRSFLDAGHYHIFKNKLAEIAKSIVPPNGTILDTGCGEGYYTNGLQESCNKSYIYGFDISKSAVKAAASRYKSISFAVASIFSIPFKDNSADLLTNIFAPIVEAEFLRVLKPGGYMILAVPGPKHLWELKEILYKNPYENTINNILYDGFTFKNRIHVNGRIDLKNLEPWQLFTMTPYYWKTDIEGGKRLKEKVELTTQIHFDFLIYKKND